MTETQAIESTEVVGPARLNAELDEIRKPYELPHHWNLRKAFLQVHSDKYNFDRLVCLSSVFINVECMGLTYPKDVMTLIKELGSKVPGLEQYRYQMEQEDEPERSRKQPHQNNFHNRYNSPHNNSSNSNNNYRNNHNNRNNNNHNRNNNNHNNRNHNWRPRY